VGSQGRKECCICFVAEDQDELTESLTELQVIQKRLETFYMQSTGQLKTLKEKLKEAEKVTKTSPGRLQPLNGRPATLTATIDKTSNSIALVENAHFSIIFTNSTIQYKSAIIDHYDNNIQQEVLKLPLYIGTEEGIRLGDLEILFKRPSLSTK